MYLLSNMAIWGIHVSFQGCIQCFFHQTPRVPVFNCSGLQGPGFISAKQAGPFFEGEKKVGGVGNLCLVDSGGCFDLRIDTYWYRILYILGDFIIIIIFIISSIVIITTITIVTFIYMYRYWEFASFIQFQRNDFKLNDVLRESPLKGTNISHLGSSHRNFGIYFLKAVYILLSVQIGLEDMAQSTSYQSYEGIMPSFLRLVCGWRTPFSLIPYHCWFL